MEENNYKTHQEEVVHLVGNFLDDIFNSTSEKLKNDNETEDKQIENLSLDLVNDIFKTSLEKVKTEAKEEKKKKKKKKNKKFRLKTLNIDTKIDVIDEEENEEETPRDKIIFKKEKNIEQEKKELKKIKDKKEIKEIKDKKEKKEKIDKKETKKKGHHKSNSMELISENVIQKFSNNKSLKKLRLIRPPPSNEIKDDFYLNKYINKNKNKINDELCITF